MIVDESQGVPLTSDEDVVAAIVRELQGKRHVRVRLWGTSMLPWVWPGARLRIRGGTARDAMVGDLVLVHRHQRLALHRVVNVDPLETQGDAYDQLDGAGRLIGIAEGVVIGRLQVPLPRRMAVAFNATALRASVRYRTVEPKVRRSLRRASSSVQSAPGLRPLRTLLLPYRIEVLEAMHADALRRYLLSRGMRPTRQVMHGWWMTIEDGERLAVVAVVRRNIVGSVRLGRDDTGNTFLTDLFVRHLYRGVGVARALVSRAIEEAEKRGHTGIIYANVRSNGHSARAAFATNGFVEMREVEPATSAHVVMGRRSGE